MAKSNVPRRSHSPLSEGDYALLADFRSELRKFLHFSKAAAKAAGVHPQQHQAMLIIRGSRERDSVTVGELALKLRVRHHTAVELAGRMEAEGLIRKTVNLADGRQVLIRLTPRSERVLRQLSAAHKAELARVGPALKEILTHLKIIS
jgi:DNA-binding MarR family transcriptional regulator